MKLKELLLKVYEGHCERLPNESDEDYLIRCGNQQFNPIGSVADRSNLPYAMKKRIVIPNKINERLRQVEWEKMEDGIKGMIKSLKLIQKTNSTDDKRKEIMINALVSDIIRRLDDLKSDIYDKARNIPPDIK
jgi:hypothetical protein